MPVERSMARGKAPSQTCEGHAARYLTGTVSFGGENMETHVTSSPPWTKSRVKGEGSKGVEWLGCIRRSIV